MNVTPPWNILHSIRIGIGDDCEYRMGEQRLMVPPPLTLRIANVARLNEVIRLAFFAT